MRSQAFFLLFIINFEMFLIVREAPNTTAPMSNLVDSISVPWYLFYMVTQNMMDAYEGKYVFFGEKSDL